MENIILKTEIKLCTLDELDNDARQLVDKAMKATDNSYSPYSKFRVGAALRLENGMEIIGANQENAAFSVTMCAERSAIFNAQSNFPHLAITHLAIAARNSEGFVNEPVSPCGSCRQALLEMEQRYKRKIKIYLYGAKGCYVINGIRSLMPLSFVEDSMR